MTLPDPLARRLSDHERDDAVAALRTHFEVGRLEPAEFDTRMQAALTAIAASDLAPLFSDLPQPHPAVLTVNQPTWNTYPAAGRPPQAGGLVPRNPAPRPVRTQTDRMLDSVQALIWPVAILLLIFGNSGIAPIILAIIVSTAIGAYRGNKRRQPPPY